MKQAIVTYVENGFKDGATARIGYRKEHTNRRWYFETAKINKDGTIDSLITERGISITQVLGFVKEMKKSGYKFKYELI